MQLVDLFLKVFADMCAALHARIAILFVFFNIRFEKSINCNKFENAFEPIKYQMDILCQRNLSLIIFLKYVLTRESLKQVCKGSVIVCSRLQALGIFDILNCFVCFAPIPFQAIEHFRLLTDKLLNRLLSLASL